MGGRLDAQGKSLVEYKTLNDAALGKLFASLEKRIDDNDIA